MTMPEKSPHMIVIEGLLEAGAKLHPPEKFGNLDELTDEELDAEIKRLARKLGLKDKKWS
jgi:hypothetical protein